MNESQQLATQADPSVGSMLQSFLATPEALKNVEVAERLMDLYERNEKREAEKQFAKAFVKLQQQMPIISAVKPIPDRNGNVKYYYAPLEEIMPKVRPVLLANGFTLSFDTEIKDDRVVLSCILQHVGGHTKTNVSMAKIGGGPPGASGAQADGAAATYAKRRALCDALAIVADLDGDGQDLKNEGSPVSWEQAAYLRELVKETNADEVAFLKYAGAPDFDSIGSTRYDMLVRALLSKKK